MEIRQGGQGRKEDKDSTLTKGEQDWLGVDGKSIKATVTNYDQAYQDFIDLTINAAQFAQGIRGHWGIENRLHWVKDVVLDEDNVPR